MRRLISGSSYLGGRVGSRSGGRWMGLKKISWGSERSGVNLMIVPRSLFLRSANFIVCAHINTTTPYQCFVWDGGGRMPARCAFPAGWLADWVV